MTRKIALAAFLVATAQAQTPPSVAAAAKAAYASIKDNFQKAAEKMPEENYSFKPVDAVQNFGQRVAHIANQMGTCSALNGQRKPSTAAGKTSKKDLVAGLADSFAECDKVFDALTDANALETVNPGRGGPQPRIAVLYNLIAHDNEVYGAIGVYLRLKGIVPPSSEGGR
ncbi:MAG: DinB family protein [Bryobacteraceae bacterium]|jgi:uncharacterized protein involved in copper resistance